MKKTAVLFAIGIVAMSAHAQDISNQLSKQFKTCITAESTEQDQEKHQACYDAEIKFQKHRLNTAWNKAITGKSPEDISKLEAAQKEWIKWRDDQDDYITNHVAGQFVTIQAISNSFLLQAIVNQTNLLESIAAAEGN
jgi:uncharacterized protein YecT (DUF1311 family)